MIRSGAVRLATTALLKLELVQKKGLSYGLVTNIR